jgi:Glycosyl hydrolase family 92
MHTNTKSPRRRHGLPHSHPRRPLRLDFYHNNLPFIGNEQGFLPTSLLPRRPLLRPSHFNSTTVGTPGNDDSGTMDAFAALTMIGIHPNPVQDVYFITAPFFREGCVTSRVTGKVATVWVSHGFGALEYKNMYVQSASCAECELDGKEYTRSSLTHDFFLNGGSAGASTWTGGIGDFGEARRTFAAEFEYDGFCEEDVYFVVGSWKRKAAAI